MNLFLFGFSGAIISALCWPSLLPLLSLPIIAGALLICVLVYRQQRLQKVVVGLSGVLAGVMWVTAYCHLLLPNIAASQQSVDRGNTTPLTVRAEIITLVSRNGDWISVDVQQLHRSPNWHGGDKWRLSWDLAKTPSIIELPQVGEIWQFELTPRAFSSILNQGGFNQQRYLLSQHISARARVNQAQRVAPASGIRAQLLQHLRQQLEGVSQRDILMALAMGQRSDISAERWQQLRNSGTAHLVAISGLHLSVISLYLFGIVNWLLNRLLPCQSRRNLLLAYGAAIIGAAAYAWLAGFGIPVQRALLMLLVLVLSLATMRFASPWERLLWALALVLLLDPLAPLSNGFWLSFFALALILLSWQSHTIKPQAETRGQQLRHWFSSLWQIQWRLCLGMSLLQGMLFGGLTLHSFWINLLLVPWFSLVVIPVTMLAFVVGMLLDMAGFIQLATSLWHLVGGLLWPAEQLWQRSDILPGAWLPIAAPMLQAGALALTAILLGRYLLRGRQRCWLVLPCLPLLWQLALQLELVAPAKWQIHVVDVGQGLAVVVQQGSHGLLYDTGAQFDDFSYAKQAILPLLSYQGIRQLDYFIVSHGDNDHAGGAAVILQQFPATKLIADIPTLPAVDNCRPHQFIWRELVVRILGPNHASAGNNGSCVVQISDATFSALLPGDIELAGEIMLTKQYAEQRANGRPLLQSELLLAPHHGSATSSTQDLLDAVKPQWAIFAAGTANRWGFPKTQVLQKFQQRHINTLTTGEVGQISIEIGQKGAEVRSYRQQIAPYWYNRLIAFGYTANPE
ncbi:DNA internalization-related competence protein ComEC/Rec2 [Shewanella sp. A3A]|nr:DNA internalization-related competence protein ComEC/Rec2 [Shewanella ferrihydritica]